ncbi:hypothetical protein P9857_08145 [Anoxybacillus geothermalis]|nr:hypothetical protein [Anoxybacillus geothermalis]
MLTFLVIFGTDSALSFYYYDKDDKERRLLYVRNVMYFRLFVAAILRFSSWRQQCCGLNFKRKKS